MSSGSRPGAADKKVVPEGTAIDTPEFTNIETVRTKPSVAKNSKGSARFGSANEAETESSKLFREETEKPEGENKSFDMDFLQTHFYGVFELPLPSNAARVTPKNVLKHTHTHTHTQKVDKWVGGSGI
jgi:hypothetical protein